MASTPAAHSSEIRLTPPAAPLRTHTRCAPASVAVKANLPEAAPAHIFLRVCVWRAGEANAVAARALRTTRTLFRGPTRARSVARQRRNLASRRHTVRHAPVDVYSRSPAGPAIVTSSSAGAPGAGNGETPAQAPLATSCLVITSPTHFVRPASTSKASEPAAPARGSASSASAKYSPRRRRLVEIGGGQKEEEEDDCMASGAMRTKPCRALTCHRYMRRPGWCSAWRSESTRRARRARTQKRQPSRNCVQAAYQYQYRRAPSTNQ